MPRHTYTAIEVADWTSHDFSRSIAYLKQQLRNAGRSLSNSFTRSEAPEVKQGDTVRINSLRKQHSLDARKNYVVKAVYVDSVLLEDDNYSQVVNKSKIRSVVNDSD